MTAQMRNFWMILNAAIHKDAALEPEKLKAPVDWAYMSLQARKQNLLPVFTDIAQQYEDYCLYPGFAADVQDTMAIVAGQMQRSEEFLDLYKAFLDAGLRPVVFKGIVLRQLYGDYKDYRVSGDEDILVRPEEYRSVREVLERKGYQCTRPKLTGRQIARMHEVTFCNAEIQLSIEVHLNLFTEEDSVRAYMNRAVRPFEDTEILEIDGVPVRVMNPTQSYLYLVFHGFNHFLSKGMGIRPMMDILKYAQAYRQRIRFSEMEEPLKTVRADAFLRDIQWIGTQLLGFPAEESAQDCGSRDLVDDLMETGIFGGSSRTDCFAANISLPASAVGTTDRKVRGLLIGAFPGRSRLMERYPCLEEKPWLLPVVWARRFVKFGRYAGKNTVEVIREILNKTEKRAEILKKYRAEKK